MGNCLCSKHSHSKAASGDLPSGALAISREEKGDFFGPGFVSFLLGDKPRTAVSPDVRPANGGGEEQKGATTSNNAGFPVTIKDVEDFRQMPRYGNVLVFTYSELRQATMNFRPDLILGEGGFGLVYKGVIDGNIRRGFKHTQVAVKVLNREGFQGDKEWLAEINYLGNLSHPNLVKLIGYCCEDEHRLLVYEHMANASLENHLFGRGNNGLPWLTRLKIALGAAKGLAFLHGAERPIIYRDFKTSNILLDAEYNGKLSDFGLAKEGPMGEQTHVSTTVMGTHGYAAPEYILTGHLTAKSDVYGFGVVLLELLFGRKSLDDDTRRRNLVDWARPLLIRSNKLFQIIDPRIDGQYTPDNLLKVARLAYDSLSQSPKVRPLMSEVVGILSDVLQNEKVLVPYMSQAATSGPAVTGATTPPRSPSPFEARVEDAEIGRRKSRAEGRGSSGSGSSQLPLDLSSFSLLGGNHCDMPKKAPQHPLPSRNPTATVTTPPRSPSPHELRREARSPAPHEARREARSPSPHEASREAWSPSGHEDGGKARSPSPHGACRKNVEINGRRVGPWSEQRMHLGGSNQPPRDLSFMERM